MPTLSQDLILLEARGLVRVTMERATPIVRFKHALTREATYNSMLQTRRIELHRAAAETLTELYPQPDLEMVLTIADHWRRGAEDARALETVFPHAQTLIYTGRGMSLATLLSGINRDNLNETQRRDFDIALADAHAARGEYEPARALYESALEHVQAPNLRTGLMERIATAAYHLADYSKAIKFYQATNALALEHNDVLHQARSLNGLGLAYWNQGDTSGALDYLEQSRVLGLALGETTELANIEFNLAGILMDRGEFAPAIVAAERALALDEKLNNQTLAARTLQLLGACYFVSGDYAKASAHYDRALKVSAELDDALGVALAHGNLGELYLAQGDSLRAITAYEQCVERFRALNLDFYLIGGLVGLAHAETRAALDSAKTACLDAADEHAQEALALAARLNSPEREGITRRVLAEILMQRGDYTAARQQAGRAVELLDALGAGLALKNAQETLERAQKSLPDS